MVTVYPPYQAVKEFGAPSYTLEGVRNVRELLDKSIEKFGPRFKEICKLSAVVVNGFHVSTAKGFQTEVRDGDEVHLINAAAGG